MKENLKMTAVAEARIKFLNMQIHSSISALNKMLSLGILTKTKNYSNSSSLLLHGKVEKFAT